MPSLASTDTRWLTQRLRAFRAQVRLNGTTLNYNGAEIDCLCPQKEQFREMREVDYIGMRDATFTIDRTDYRRLNIGDRDVISSVNSQFEIVSILDDDADATVDLKAKMLQ